MTGWPLTEHMLSDGENKMVTGQSGDRQMPNEAPGAGEPDVIDQAAELRNLVLQTSWQQRARAAPAPRLIVLTGGKGGVGVTTLAVNLALALADQALRVVLIDGDLYRADVAQLCQLSERADVGDILCGKRSIHEVLQVAAGGIQVVPGLWAPEEPWTLHDAAQQRLIRQIQSLGPHADLVLLDIGSVSRTAVQRYWMAADEAIVVTTADSVAIMDCYATIKTALSDAQHSGPLWLVVNQVDTDRRAREVHDRIQRSARRFLGREVAYLGWLPQDPLIPAAAARRVPLLLDQPSAPAALAVGRLAGQLMQVPDGDGQRRAPLAA
jgi:flagellar biosynthesis protein FlhG